MGKADAIEHLGDAKYRIKLLLDKSSIESQIEKFTAQKNDLESRRLDLVLTEIPQAEALRDQKLIDIDNLISSLDLSDPNFNKQLREATQALNEAAIALRLLIEERDTNVAQQAELAQKIKELEEVTTEHDIEAWCADLSTGLAESGFLGTIEVPGEIDPDNIEVVIQPDQPNGQDGNAEFDEARDGALTPTLAMSAEAVAYNLAILPGWQTFQPTYRFGKVVGFGEDGTIDVELLEPNISSEIPNRLTALDVTPKDIDTNQPIILTGLEVSYIDCDADAFLVDDEVVIKFRESENKNPLVIGFRKNPRSCRAIRIFTPTGGLSLSSSDDWSFQAKENPEYGNINWFSQDTRRAISWHGPAGRYVFFPPQPVFGLPVDFLSQALYTEGKRISDAPGPVIGACIRREEDGIDYIIVVTYEVNEEVSITERIWKKPLGGGAWQQLGSHTWPDDPFIESPEVFPNSGNEIGHYLFNESGTEAVAVKPCFWRNQALFAILDWSRIVTLNVGPTNANFSFSPLEDASIFFTDNWTFEKIVAVDYIRDTKVTATVETVQTRSENPTFITLTRTLKTDMGHSAFLSYGEQGQAADESRRNDIRYLDLRTNPPTYIYTRIEGFRTGTKSIRVAGNPGDHIIGSEETISSVPGAGNPFSFGGILALARPGRAAGSLYAPAGTYALNERDGFVVAESHNEINFIHTEDDINILTGESGFISPVGVG